MLSLAGVQYTWAGYVIAVTGVRTLKVGFMAPIDLCDSVTRCFLHSPGSFLGALAAEQLLLGSCT